MELDMYDFGGDFAQTYEETCDKCGKILQVSAQKDDFPEYYTHIYVMCECGESTPFELPVN